MLRPKGGCLSRTRLTSALFLAPRASLLLRSLPQSLPPETLLFFVALPRRSAHRPRENIRVCANLSQTASFHPLLCTGPSRASRPHRAESPHSCENIR